MMSVINSFFEKKDIREFIFTSNCWEEFANKINPQKTKVKGNAFELLCMCYLQNDDFYSSIFKNVFHESEVDYALKVEKLKLAKNDIGVDLICEDYDGGYWAVQCKYRSNPKRNLQLSKGISEFFDMTGGQKIKDELYNRILMSSTNGLSANITNYHQDFHEILGDCFKKLDYFDFEKYKNYLKKRYSSFGKKKKLRDEPYQQKAISDVIAGFETDNMGQLIMACGSGKTLTALQIKEKMEFNKVLYLVPSLNLINQSLNEWVTYSSNHFKAVCVCSDKSTSRVGTKKDSWLIPEREVGIPVISHGETISKELRDKENYVVFCTYDSLKIIEKSQKNFNLDEFDITFCDEAHNCAGDGYKESGLILHDKRINTKRKLFMTATPLNIDQKIKLQAIEKGKEYASMDDPKKFGKVFHKLTFRKAIDEKILVPYQIILADVTQAEEKDLRKILNREYVELPKFLTDAETLSSDITLLKSIKKYDLQKIITFHRKVDFAKNLSLRLPEVWQWMSKTEKSFSKPKCEYISGKDHSQYQRKDVLYQLSHLENDENMIISNAQCLSEGVNVPSLDAICFMDPRRSPINIIQAVGRVMRSSKGKSMGYIIIPFFIEDFHSLEETINQSRYKFIWDIIKVLCRYDDYLFETIKHLRIEIGRRKIPSRRRTGLELPREIIISERLKNIFTESIKTHLIENVSEDWFENYGELKEYLLKNNYSCPPTKGHKLSSWIDRQRNLRLNDYLPDEKIKKLDELIPIGWFWNIQNKVVDDYLRAFNDYLSAHKHLVILDKDKDCGNKVRRIRAKYKETPPDPVYKGLYKQLNEWSKFGWMWDRDKEVFLDKIEFIKYQILNNETLELKDNFIVEGTNKTYRLDSNKKWIKEFKLNSFISGIRKRYEFTKYFQIEKYRNDLLLRFPKYNQKRKMLEEYEIDALENINLWYWSRIDGRIRVYKECIKKEIEINPSTKVDFDLIEFRNVGRWLTTIEKSLRDDTLPLYVRDKLKSIKGTPFEKYF